MRRMIERTAVLAGALLATFSGLSQGQALEYKGTKLGTSLQDFKAANPDMDCYSTTCRQVRGGSSKPPYYAGRMVESIEARFSSDQLDQVSILFFPGDHQLISDALASKYGDPTTRKASEYKTRGGAVAEQIVSKWSVDGGEISLSRYGASLSYGYLQITSADGFARLKREAAERAEKAKKDI